jgi:hypothetical protein
MNGKLIQLIVIISFHILGNTLYSRFRARRKWKINNRLLGIELSRRESKITFKT